MVKYSRTKKNIMGDLTIDMTPMIDVTFILLIFFVITANIAQHVYSITLPDADASYQNQNFKEKTLKITIFANGSVAVGTKEYQQINTVKQIIRDEFLRNPKTNIILIPDTKAESGVLLSLLTFLEGNNIQNVDILVQDGKK
jgi:biopolymer transport protein ExbD